MKFSEPKVLGLPGLPPWLDIPKVRRLAAELDCTEEEAKTMLFNQGRGKPKEVVDETRQLSFKELREGIRPEPYRGSLSSIPRTVGDEQTDDGW